MSGFRFIEGLIRKISRLPGLSFLDGYLMKIHGKRTMIEQAVGDQVGYVHTSRGVVRDVMNVYDTDDDVDDLEDDEEYKTDQYEHDENAEEEYEDDDYDADDYDADDYDPDDYAENEFEIDDYY